MRDRFPLLVVFGLLLFGVLGYFLVRGAERGSFADKLSTYRSEKDGARALFLLAEGSSLPVARHQESLDVLEGGKNLVLLGVSFSEKDEHEHPQPFFSRDGGFPSGEDPDEDDERVGLNELRSSSVSKEEREKLLEHVKGGATLVYLPWAQDENPLLKSVDVHLYPAEKSYGIRTLVPAQPSPYTLGAQRLEATVRSYLDLPDDAVPLLLDDKLSEVVAGVVPYGQGQIIVIAAPELAMNRALARADNARFWLSLLSTVSQSGTVAFDEFHHGFTSDRSVAEFGVRYGLQYVAAQLLVGLALWAISLRRFGRPRPPPEEIRLGGTDALSASSRLYREGRHHGYAAMLLVRGVGEEYARQAGISPRATPAEIATALSSRGRSDLAAILSDVAQLAQTAASEADVQHVATQAAAAHAHVHHRRRLTAVQKALAPRLTSAEIPDHRPVDEPRRSSP